MFSVIHTLYRGWGIGGVTAPDLYLNQASLLVCTGGGGGGRTGNVPMGEISDLRWITCW